jgi:hypothetical protein
VPTICLIDCDEARRLLLENIVNALVAPHAGVSVGVLRTVRGAALPSGEEPALALWHVGERQDVEERGLLPAQLADFVNHESRYVAAYTGGAISWTSRQSMPPEGSRFSINYGAAAGHVPDRLAKAVTKTVRRWLAEHRLAAGDLGTSWLGVDQLLEAQLTFLTACLDLAPPSEELEAALRTLRAEHPDIQLDVDSIRNAGTNALKDLRDRLFGQ